MYYMDKVIFALFWLGVGATYQESQHTSSIIEGPGLDPANIISAARYIFIKFNGTEVDSHQLVFKAQGLATDGTKRPCRVWYNILDRKDGSFIARYKLYEPCQNFRLDITYQGNHIGKSPYKYSSVIKHEQCYCPSQDIAAWLKHNDCGSVPEQITLDLQYFRNIDWDKLRDKVVQRFNKPESISICHYVIVDNELHRTCYGKHVGFKMFMDNILLSLLRKMRMPDMEFFVNLGDWPLVKEKAVPVLSWCGSEDTYDIVMPTYDITESTLENMGRVTLDMLSVQGNTELPWEQRIAKAFWRGRDSNPNRLKLIDLSRSQSELFNVSMTNFFFYRDKIEEYGPKTPHLSFYKFFDFKYQISIDGTVAAYRFPYLLGGGSLIFKQSSKYYEHFYHKLEPNVHYIPVAEDLSDLIDNLHSAINNDKEAKEIALNGQHFANNNLLPQHVICYHVHLFQEYSKLLIGKINVLKNMENIDQPNGSKDCNCEYSKDYRDEL